MVRSTILRIAALCAAVLLLGTRAFAQDVDEGSLPTGSRVRVELRDGSVVAGSIVRHDDEHVTVRSASGVETTIPRSEIVRIEPLGKGHYALCDPNASRLFLAPTALPMRQGQVVLSAHEIVLTMATVGATDWLTLAAGTPLVPEVAFREIYLLPKIVLVHHGLLSAAVGSFNIFGEDSGGVLYSVGTFGTTETSATAGVGFAYVSRDASDAAVLMVGGQLQVAEGVKVITENYFAPAGGRDAVVSAGLRFFGEHLSGDFGFFTAASALREIDYFPFLPWVSFSVRVGR